MAKLNASGSALVYSTFLGGNDSDSGTGIAVDAAGDAYVRGHTESTNFPTTAGAFDITFNGGTLDAFVAKLNASGSALVYSTYLGGSGSDSSYPAGAIALDATGSAYVTGTTSSANFPTTAGAFDTAYNGNEDAFVAELNTSGSALVYSTYVGGSGNDEGWGIAVDAAGSAYVTGLTSSSNFPTTAGAFDTTYNGNGDAFVAELNTSGSGLVYSTYLGGSSGDQGNSVALDAVGNVYVAGQIASSDFPTTPGAFQTSSGGGEDAFVAKFSGFAVAAAPSISSVIPAQPQATNGYQDFTINGGGFDGSAYVNLMDNGGKTHQLSAAHPEPEQHPDHGQPELHHRGRGHMASPSRRRQRASLRLVPIPGRRGGAHRSDRAGAFQQPADLGQHSASRSRGESALDPFQREPRATLRPLPQRHARLRQRREPHPDLVLQRAWAVARPDLHVLCHRPQLRGFHSVEHH